LFNIQKDSFIIVCKTSFYSTSTTEDQDRRAIAD
jgi:hypothetical protein